MFGKIFFRGQYGIKTRKREIENESHVLKDECITLITPKLILGFTLLAIVFFILFFYKKQVETNRREFNSMISTIQAEKVAIYNKVKKDADYAVEMVIRDITTKLENVLLKDFTDKVDLYNQFASNEFSDELLRSLNKVILSSGYERKLSGFKPEIIIGTPHTIIMDTRYKLENFGGLKKTNWKAKARSLPYPDKVEMLFNKILSNYPLDSNVIPNKNCVQKPEFESSNISLRDIFRTKFEQDSRSLREFDVFKVSYIYENSDIFGRFDYYGGNEPEYSHKIIILVTYNMFEYLTMHNPELLAILSLDTRFSNRDNPFMSKELIFLLATYVCTILAIYCLILMEHFDTITRKAYFASKRKKKTSDQNEGNSCYGENFLSAEDRIEQINAPRDDTENKFTK